MPSPTVPSILRRPGFSGVIAMIGISFALRAPITAVPPVVSDLEAALGVSPGAVALLTSIPVLCFGLVTPVSSTLLRVLGLRVSGAICLGGVVAGSLLRSGGSFALALAGTLLIGVAISIGNLVVPVLIGRAYPMRASSLMGIYSSVMNVGSTAATALTVGLAVAFGWQLAIASWGVVLGGVGLLAWLLFLPASAVHAAQPSPPPTARSANEEADEDAPLTARSANEEADEAGLDAPLKARSTKKSKGSLTQTLRSPVAWLLAGAFAAQAMCWYAVTAWLPSALRDVVGMSQAGAGVAASAFQLAGIAGPLLVPAFLAAARRRWLRHDLTRPVRARLEQRDEAALVALLIALWAALPLGMLLAPGGWLTWTLLSGIAQGGFFTIVFLLVVRRTRTDDENRRTATLVQTIGYSAAATAPVLVGLVHERVAGWTVLFAMVGVLVVIMAVCGLAAALRPIPDRDY